MPVCYVALSSINISFFFFLRMHPSLTPSFTPSFSCPFFYFLFFILSLRSHTLTLSSILFVSYSYSYSSYSFLLPTPSLYSFSSSSLLLLNYLFAHIYTHLPFFSFCSLPVSLMDASVHLLLLRTATFAAE
ncbi:MAG: hypothetical protein JOS17DRAFT_322808 [Linnemannia elongata]|nr:MAG: hypothetical protein JOS17DRAFT_322808 [Linnemannia elongata]